MRQWSKGSLLAAAGVGLLWAVRRAMRGWRAYDLRDKLVLITGGSRGLGLVLAHELLRQGARVAICARDELELERARGHLSHHDRVLAVACDVTDRAQVEAMVRLVAWAPRAFGAGTAIQSCLPRG